MEEEEEDDDVDDDYDGPTTRPESVGQGIAICDGLWCVEAGWRVVSRADVVLCCCW